MLIKRSIASTPRSSEVTPERIYLRRRELMGAGGILLAGSLLPACGDASEQVDAGSSSAHENGHTRLLQDKIRARSQWPDSTTEAKTPFADVTRYNNFYEFGTGKEDPAKHAGTLRTVPWSVEISGEVEKPGTYQLEDLLRPLDLQERVYRLRCVEAWSMVVPWVGFPLVELLRRFQPTSRARYVAFQTLYDPEQMPGQRSRFSTIDYPYVEGLRIDEAVHPLTLMAVGLYGRDLPRQNGAPLRLVVPWKYGFKSIKSIVRIHLQERQPPTTWSQIAPNEYGFFANVNPAVSHPRWSQSRERRLPSGLFDQNWKETLPFNGYGDQVARLYAGMDLKKFY